ncbi:MAG: RdgB/HAM1 family non-canonical purine NTP pyrophosphatase [Steroidobacteraceae bacterium]
MSERIHTAFKLVLASANPGKQREFAALLAAQGIELLLQSSLGIHSVDETGTSFEANALLKARHAAACSALPALADDSGLEVDALDGAPGVHSARYAGDGASDQDNNARLLAALMGVEQSARTARYRCVLAFVRGPDDAAPLLASGTWSGTIATAPRGQGGFGYDPLFIPEGHALSAAQLPGELKNRLSHRATALRAMLRELQQHWLRPREPQ